MKQGNRGAVDDIHHTLVQLSGVVKCSLPEVPADFIDLTAIDIHSAGLPLDLAKVIGDPVEVKLAGQVAARHMKGQK